MEQNVLSLHVGKKKFFFYVFRITGKCVWKQVPLSNQQYSNKETKQKKKATTKSLW